MGDPARMAPHVRAVGILFIVTSSLVLLAGAIAAVLIFGSGALLDSTDHPTAAAWARGIGWVLVALVLLVGVPDLVTGIALLQRKPWARLGVIGSSILLLLAFPLGTLLGGYAIWAMLHPDTKAYLAAASSPPRPDGWTQVRP